MDFLIGGMPRGGTTLLGRLAGSHDQSFCYAYESHLAPFLLHVAGDRPVPPSKIPTVIDAMRRQTESVLIEMPKWNIARGSIATVQFDEAMVASIISTTAELMVAGCFGVELISKVMKAFSMYLPDAASLGEKTPSNLEVLAKFPDLVPRSCVAVREPFASIKSMERRAGDDADNYNSVFGRSTLDRIGLYMQNLLQLIELQNNNSVLVSRYEDVVANFDDEVTQIVNHLRLGLSGSALDHSGIAAVKKTVEQISAGRGGSAPADGFSALDRWLISATTGRLLGELGYDLPIHSLTERPDELASDSQVEVIFGAHQLEPTGGRWLDKDAVLLVMVPSAVTSTLDVRVWTDCAHHLNLTETDGIDIGSLNEPAVRLRHSSFSGGLLQVDLPLRTATKLATAWGIDLHAVRIQSSFSMVPAAIEGLGADMRRRSVLLQEAQVYHD